MMTVFLGLSFLDVAAASIAADLAERPPDAPFAYLVTPNADHFVRLARMPHLRPLYDRAEWLCLDSMAVAHGARWLGLRAPTVATGADILADLLDHHLRPGDRVTIIGLDPAGLAVLRLLRPRVEVAHHCPPPGLAQDPQAFLQAVRFAVAHPARFTLIAVGSPVQEKLAAAIAAGGATGIGLCVGAALDFWTGLTPRAPASLRRLGLEWLHRLWREPRRLARRYLIDDWAILRLLLVARWRDGRAAGGQLVPHPAGVVQDLHRHAATRESVSTMMRVSQQKKG
jgi:exopolysaccharide biosynthesis WecB/TagA/CpsF family protein